jgi:type II secretory pathway pseudopilin PulG
MNSQNNKKLIKQENGITLIALIVTIIIMLILAGLGIKFGIDANEKTKLENIKLNMETIRLKTQIIADKNSNDGTLNPLIGIKIEDNTTYTIPEELQTLLQTQENEELKYKSCYILEQTDLIIKD